MNRLRKVTLVLCAIVSASASHAQAPTTKPAALNIVTVSFTNVVLHTVEAQKAMAQLQTQFAPRQAQLQALNDEVEKLRKQIQSNSENTSEAEREASAEALDRKEKQLQRQTEDFRTDSETESQQVFQRVAAKVYDFLQAYAQHHGYSAVIERGSDASPVVWYVDSNIDITDQLTKDYDAHSASGSLHTPAGSPVRSEPKPKKSLPETPSPRQ